ncbi:hypothetical protein SLA2020_308290 [Shorea laevis]
MAATVLWQSLRSVLSSANHESASRVRDAGGIPARGHCRRQCQLRVALVGTGGGTVVDWLLETVATASVRSETHAEAARGLAYMVADLNVCKDVLGRPLAVANLLRFIFSCQPQRRSKKHSRRSSFFVSDYLKGRSLLVAAIMDIVTSNCDNLEKVSFMPLPPENAETRDIAAAIQVIEEGGMHSDEQQVGIMKVVEEV